MDSLFVLDTVGETTALEDRAVPKLHRKKAKSVVGLLEPATTSAAKLSTTLHRGGSTAEHYDDDDEDDEDADFGGKNDVCYIEIVLFKLELNDLKHCSKTQTSRVPPASLTSRT